MKISCICGNVLRDQTDQIPYKARFIADQDYDDLLMGVEQQVAGILSQLLGTQTATKLTELIARVLCDALHSYTRTMYQCRNCGRICVDDPYDQRELQWFKPEEDSQWKNVLVSVNGEDSKVWLRNLVGHWDASQSYGQLWFDPSAGERGGFEQFDDWSSLERRYYELFELQRADGNLVGARLGIESESEAIRDVHSWSLTQ